MGVRSRGRSIAATFGLLLVLAGVAGAVVLWVMADRRTEQAVEAFARGPVGCTTTLEFGDVGTFYVYEEVVGAASDVFDECTPDATPDRQFSVELLDDGRPIAARTDTSIEYDTADAIGTSVARLEIGEPGRYDLVVEGFDPTVVAAVGRDPEQGVDELRRGSIVIGVVGVLLGALMLLLAGRRSRRAATVSPPVGPGWGPAPRTDADALVWPPEPPRVRQTPVNPMLPPEPVSVEQGERSSSPEPVSVEQGERSSSPWAPPRAGERRDPPPPG